MKVNEQNLRLALIEITNRAKEGKPMAIYQLCKDFHLGQSVVARLKYVLLEADFHPECKETPVKRMHVARDKKTWKLNYKSSTGSYKWNGLQEEFEDILHKMYEMPTKERSVEDMSLLIYDERTGDFIPKGQLESPIAPEGKIYDYTGTLRNFSDKELLAELQRREDERKAAEELARKKSLVEEFLTAYGMTIDDILEIASVI